MARPGLSVWHHAAAPSKPVARKYHEKHWLIKLTFLFHLLWGEYKHVSIIFQYVEFQVIFKDFHGFILQYIYILKKRQSWDESIFSAFGCWASASRQPQRGFALTSYLRHVFLSKASHLLFCSEFQMCRALRIRTKLKSCFFYHTKPNLVHYFIYILDCTDQTYSTDVLIMNRIVSCSTMSVFILVTCVY